MKTVRMVRDFDYRAHRCITIAFKKGETYRRVLEAAARAIVKAQAGEIVSNDNSYRPARASDVRQAG